MRQSPQAEAQSGNSGMRSGSDLQRRFWLALLLYAILAAAVWFTMDAGKVDVFGRPVELRLVPLVIIGGLALRTVLAVQAEKIRRDGGRDASGS
ncbi:MAG TPA: hypothetical protein VHD85_05180 [Terracidiphilus sp.]|nr:hypothetical protein [Terracidiphilus sp.]